MVPRRLRLSGQDSFLLLGPRRVGKSTYLRERFADAHWIDLLQTDVFYEYRARPSLLRESAPPSGTTVVIDEVQLIPDLLREVHWLLENRRLRFILCGSSARKLRREGVTNLAGRLRSAWLHPLTYSEIPEFVLEERLQLGSLPPVVFGEDPWKRLQDYAGEYLREEVQNEGAVRNIPAFTRFLDMASLSNGELLSFATVARDCGVAAKTARDYFDVLVDTLIGFYLDAWVRSKKRRAITTSKFYFFDCGIPNRLLGRRLSPKTPEFGKAFEHWLILEAIAARDYEGKIERLSFWRSASGFEVDLLIDEHTACEFKTGKVTAADGRGLLALAQELPLRNRWIVSYQDARVRRLESGIVVVPWRMFPPLLAEGDFKSLR